jgi:hypothetical protein
LSKNSRLRLRMLFVLTPNSFSMVNRTARVHF